MNNEVIPSPGDSIPKVEALPLVYSASVNEFTLLYIVEGTRASESQNPALPLSQGNEEVGV